MRVVQAQVRGESHDGKSAASEAIIADGFKPGSRAHIVLTGWDFTFKFGDHNVLKMNLLLRQAVPGGWEWAHEVNVGPDGKIKAQYIASFGSENQDNPFTFLVNYAVFGE